MGKPTGLVHCFGEEINFDGLRDCFIKIECFECDKAAITKYGEECEGCRWYPHSKKDKKKPKYCAALKAEGSAELGVNPGYAQEVGRHWVSLFTEPELRIFGFNWPPKPEKNLFGKRVSAGAFWIVHHINGIHSDDRPENLVLLLNSEHRTLEAIRNRGVKGELAETKRYVDFIKDAKQRMSELASELRGEDVQ